MRNVVVYGDIDTGGSRELGDEGVVGWGWGKLEGK